MCDTFDRVYRGEIKRLIVNIPPGYSKTELGVINFMAHGFAINPAARFIHASYSQQLALDNSAKARDIINLEGYQELWPVKLKADTSAKGLWSTTDGGHVRAAASGEPITGFRAGRLLDDGEAWKFTGALIIDDPLKPDDALSDTTRKFINDRWDNTFKSRLGDENVPVIVIMQRLHVDDFVAHLLEESGERWHVLKLPVWIEGECAPIHDNAIMVQHGLPTGPLWEKKHNVEQIDVLRPRRFSFASQYMQEPAILGGGLFKSEWWQFYDVAPEIEWRSIYADTAQKTKESSDYSVFQCWGRSTAGKAILLDQIRGKWEAPELLVQARAFWLKHKAIEGQGALRALKVEDKVSGTGLIQTLKREGIPVLGIQRGTDKLTRALDASPMVESGNVVLPRNAPWLSDFLAEMEAFPNGAHDDQVDPAADAISDISGVHQPEPFQWYVGK